MKKTDLIYIIPEIIGSVGFIIASIIHLKNSSIDAGLWDFIFQVGLSMIVIMEIGLKGMFSGIEQLRKRKDV